MAFEKKVNSLLKTSVSNSFIKEAMKVSNECLSGNGALKYSTSGNDFVDDFASIAKFKEPRSYDEVAKNFSFI